MINRRIGLTSILSVAGLASICFAGSMAFRLMGKKFNKPALDPVAEFRKIKSICTSDSVIDLVGEIRLFDSESADKVKEQMEFHIVRSGASLYQEIGYVKNICDGEVWLQIDTVNKFVMIDDATNQPKVNDLFAVDKVSDDTAETKFDPHVIEDGKERTIRLMPVNNPDIRKIDLTYDLNEYRLLKSKIEWRKYPGSVQSPEGDSVLITNIDYHYLIGRPFNIDSVVDETVSRNKGKIVLMDKYKSYRLIGNNLVRN